MCLQLKQLRMIIHDTGGCKLMRMAVIFLMSLAIFTSCAENDDLPPIITLNGADTVYHVLNEVYVDAGASATDETDGNLNSNIYIDNQVDEDRMGEYSVTYRVVDKSGNDATPVTRVVYVYNTGLTYYGDYTAQENEIFPGQSGCSYPSYIWVDSTVNNRLVFLNHACNLQRNVFVDVYDSVVVIPFQLIQDSVINISLQGSGTINDSVIFMEYTRMDSVQTSYWNATFTRLK